MHRSLSRLCSSPKRNYNAFTQIPYPQPVSEQLNTCRAVNGYTSHFWITTEEFEILKGKYDLTLKAGQHANKVAHGDTIAHEMYNNDQFTDPYFLRLYAQVAKQQSRKVDASEVQWKRISQKFRK